MKEYNFDENKSMGETVRIDDIKLKLNEMEEQNGYDDGYDDYEDYDDFGDTTDFGDTADFGDTTDFGDTAEYDDYDEPPVKKRNKDGGRPGRNGSGGGRTIIYVVAAVILVIVVALAVMFAMNSSTSGNDTEEEEVDAEYFYGVVVSVSDNRFEIIDTEDGTTGFYTLDSSVNITKEDGRKAAYSTITRGDIIYIGMSNETGDIVSIEYTDDVWEKESFENIEVDTEKMTISNGITTYEYDKNTLFIYSGDFISAEDLSSEDVVTLSGVKDTVWTVTIEKYHGFIKIENGDKIENLEITIDGEAVEFEDDIATVSAGTHKLGISGSNIDTLSVDIHISNGETYSVDMAAVQEKTGVLTLKVNVKDCIAVVDGRQIDVDSPVVLSFGSYTISVSAEGYKTYTGTVVISEPLVEADIELEKIEVQTASITVDSNPSGATVYANNAVIGVTPFTTQINYGDYQITIKKDGYVDYNLSTTVDEAQKTISVLLTEE